jgi:hypothetical protein
MIRFPAIPTVETGHALGATILNSYNSGVRYLLGRSHEPMPAQMEIIGTTTSVTDVYIGSYFLPIRGNRFGYHYILNSGGGGGYVATLTVKVGATVIFTDSTAAGGSKSVAVTDLDATTFGLVDGTIAQFNIYLKQSAGGASLASCRFWEFNIHWAAVTGWATPTTFANAATSSAAGLNVLQTDLNALKTWRLSNAVALTTIPNIFYTSGSASSLAAGTFAYRYRGDFLRLNTWALSVIGAAYHWRWKVAAAKWGAGSADIVADSAWIEQTTDAGLWGTEVSQATGALGFTLGDWVEIVFWVTGTTVVNLAVKNYICQRYSSGTPLAGYTALTDWTEGDVTIGATKLNAISTDLTYFYSGAETLWGYCQASVNTYGLNQQRMMGIHTHRWLIYYAIQGQTPQLLYGPSFSRSVTLSIGLASTWLVYDLESIGLAPGSIYELTLCYGAFESDTSAV